MAGRGLGLPLSYPCFGYRPRAVRTILIISAVGPLNNYHNSNIYKPICPSLQLNSLSKQISTFASIYIHTILCSCKPYVSPL